MPKLATIRSSLDNLFKMKKDKVFEDGSIYKKELDEAWDISEVQAIKLLRGWSGGCFSIGDIKKELHRRYKGE